MLTMIEGVLCDDSGGAVGNLRRRGARYDRRHWIRLFTSAMLLIYKSRTERICRLIFVVLRSVAMPWRSLLERSRRMPSTEGTGEE